MYAIYITRETELSRYSRFLFDIKGLYNSNLLTLNFKVRRAITLTYICLDEFMIVYDNNISYDYRERPYDVFMLLNMRSTVAGKSLWATHAAYLGLYRDKNKTFIFLLRRALPPLTPGLVVWALQVLQSCH